MSAFAGAGGQIVNTTAGNKAVTLAGATAGDLLVVVCLLTGATTPPTVTDDNGSGTYVEVTGGGFVKNASADKVTIFVRTALVPATLSTIITMTSPGGDTGGGLLVYRVTGMTRTGQAAVRQVAGQSNQAASGTPAPVFPQACLTTNSVIGAVLNETNPATITPTASPVFTEKHDTGYATPTTGIETQTLDSGFTGTTLTWGGTSATQFASIAAELEAGPITSPRPAQQPRAAIGRRLSAIRRQVEVVALRPLALAIQAAAVVIPPRPQVIDPVRTPRQQRRSTVRAPRPAALAVPPAAFVKPPPIQVIDPPRAAARQRHSAIIIQQAAAAAASIPAPPRPVVPPALRLAPERRRLSHVAAPRPAALSAQPPAVVYPPRPVVVPSHRPLPAGRHAEVLAPRPAALAVPPAVAIVAPTRPIVIPARRPLAAGRRVAVRAPRPAALAVAPAAVVVPPRPLVVTADRVAMSARRGDTLAPRPAALAAQVVVQVVMPPRPVVVMARALPAVKRPASRRVLARRPVIAPSLPPRRAATITTTRRADRGRGRVLAPRPRFAGLPAPPSVVAASPTRTAGSSGADSATGGRGVSRARGGGGASGLGGTSGRSDTIGGTGRSEA